jgi:hypothetical protein
VRFPETLLAEARAVKIRPESLNDLVIAAVDREVRRRRAVAALDQMAQVREQVYARTGPQPDPVPLIRALREGDGRRA